MMLSPPSFLFSQKSAKTQTPHMKAKQLNKKNGKDMLRREQEWSQSMKAPKKSSNKVGTLGDSGIVEHFWRAEIKTLIIL